jgi:hypothetical protein
MLLKLLKKVNTMKKIAYLLTILGIIATYFFYCTDPSNPLDPNLRNYVNTNISVITNNNSINKDTIYLSTEDTLKVGIETNFIDRIDSIRIDFDLNEISDTLLYVNIKNLRFDKTEKLIYLNIPKVYEISKTYLVEVYAYTVNKQNPADTLTVIVGGVAPKITVQPKDTVVEETYSASFSIQASGTKTLTYQWYKASDTSKLNGTPIENALNTTYSNNVVSMNDSGYYFCLIKNNFGQITTRSAQLKVTPQQLGADAPEVSFAQDSISISESNLNIVIPLILNKPSTKEVIARIEIEKVSTAKQDSDFILISREITFPPNITLQNIPVKLIDDDLLEPTESINCILGSSRNARMGTPNRFKINIIDDDAPDSTWPEISFSQQAAEGFEGENSSISVVLKKSHEWNKPVRVNCIISKSSTASADDYTFTDSVITFGPTESEKKITIQILKDSIKENDELIVFELQQPSKAVLSKTNPVTFTYKIKDNNRCIVNFETLEQSGLEGDTTNLQDSIRVVLSSLSLSEVTVHYHFIDSLSTAINQGTDYLLMGDGILKFPPLTRTATIPLSIMGDKLVEGDEIIAITLSNPSGAELPTVNTPFKYIIRDNEISSIAFSRSSTSITEGSGDISIPVQLSTLVMDTVKVDFKITGTARNSSADYQIKNLNSATLTFAPLQLTQSIDIKIINDSLNEPEQSFIIKLENVRGKATIGMLDTHTVTITDDDIPSFSFQNATGTINESNGMVDIPVKLTNPSLYPLAIRYMIEASGTTAIPNVDYILPATDTILFNSKDTLTNFRFTILKDNTDENDKTLSIRLYPADNNSKAGAVVNYILTIHNTDSLPKVSFSKDTSVINESGNMIELPIIVSGKTEKQIAVNYQISATSPQCDTSDFILTGSGLLRFQNSDDNKVVIQIKNDTIPNELDWIEVSLYNFQNLQAGQITKSRIYITDNDYQVTLLASGDSGTVQPSGARIVQAGSDLQIIAKPKSHYHLVRWIPTAGLVIDNILKDTTRILNVQSSGTVTAEFAVDTQTVTISAGLNGTINPTGDFKVAYSKVFVPGTVQASTGHHFAYWEISPQIKANGDLTDPTCTFTINGNGTIRAIFAIEGFVAFIQSNNNTYGTTQPTGAQNVNYGATLDLHAIPTATAHSHFMHWATSGTITPANLTSTTSPITTLRNLSGSGTVTAVFGLDSFTIAIASADTSLGTTDPNISVIKPFGDTIQIRAVSKTGYKFSNWLIPVGNSNITIGRATDSQTVISAISGNANVVANFVIKTYEINVSAGANGTVFNPGIHIVNHNGTYTLRVNQPASGYEFSRWNITQGALNVSIADAYNDTTDITNVQGPATISAVFALKRYTLNLTSTDPSLGTVTPPTITGIAHGTKTRFVASPNPVNAQIIQFSRWESNDANVTYTSPDTVTLVNNATLRAVFSYRAFPLSINTTPTGGTIQSTLASGSHPYNTPFTLTATPLPGWEFIQWIGDTINNSAVNPITTTIGTSNTISAEFRRLNYTISITQSTGGTVTLDPPGPSYPFETQVRVIATPDTGYRFSQWSGGISGTTNPYTITISNNISIGASFTEIPGTPGVIYVRRNASGLNNGTNWVNAYMSISDAITNAPTNSQIWVAKGSYSDVSSDGISLKNGTNLFGGFSGNESTLNQRTFQSNQTILNGINKSYIIIIDGVSNVIVDGFTLMNSNACLIYTNSPFTSIRNCIFKNNNPGTIPNPDATAILTETANSITINNCVFYNNIGNSGSCAQIYSPNTRFTNCIFAANRGPAINDQNNSVTQPTCFYNCTIVNNNNTNSSRPGGITSLGRITIRGCILYGNTNQSSPQRGTQIDSTDIVSSSCIQECLNGTIGVIKKTNNWAATNIMISPNFASATIPSQDSTWYSSVIDNLPFIPKEINCINRVQYGDKPLTDLRNIQRDLISEMGAYEYITNP